MNDSGLDQTLKEIERPLALAYEYLAARSSRIRKAWAKLLERYEPCRAYLPHLAGLQLPQRICDLSSSHSRGNWDQVEQAGLELASKAVPAACAVAAVSVYVDCSIASFKCDEATRERWARALSRWASVYQILLLGGYQKHALIEGERQQTRIAQAEQRARDFSVELADAYEKERRRLAQDLHDEIGHDLVVLKLYTEMTARDLKKGELDQVRRRLKQSISLINHALRGVRHLTFDLGPAVWSEQGFLDAVRLYVRQFGYRTGLKVRFSAIRLKIKLPARYETALYKALQGALSNIAAHAGAHHAWITLSSRRDSVVMRVEDDGKGFDVNRKLQAPPRSFGLRAMRDRIELLGGSIQFMSRRAAKGTGHGTAIEFLLPLHGLEAK